ncbi:Glycoside hydrolase family 5 protein [Mycena venus]|uniref:Glycoside hydrolase family 5 protein n=1 Tax=Mycena venus TaxID=2733690 RepID=A0A8H7CCK7_9AGAR|nr:Glycoside hydrolase family 5 protein [Mycena venus]
MDPRLVYRILRKASDWALVGFYSEAYVDEGQQNFPKDTPLIVTPCHHNELIDVATLAATIPHRRKVSFWAKSTTFAVPVFGFLLSSSGKYPLYFDNVHRAEIFPGAIPVRRNPDKADAGASNAALFSTSTTALARNQVIGVFPEGTSYTEPAIAQILSGAAWAALEFMRSQYADGKTRSVLVIPVGIVYTNKSKFRSRVRVQYGPPIDMASYVSASLFDSQNAEAERVVVKTVMNDIEAQLLKMTINAPDWLVNLFSSSEDSELVSMKRALTKYFSLLQYSNITHAQLYELNDNGRIPSAAFIFQFILIALRTLLHPSFLLFIPPFIAHIPAYLFAGLGSRLAPPGEEESQAQFKVILGGFGAGVGAGMSSYWITKLGKASDIIPLNLTKTRSKLFLWAFTAWFLVKWHWALVDSNYTRFRLLSASYKVLMSSLQPRAWDLSLAQIAPYETPPAPAANPFLKKKEGPTALGGKAWLKAQPPPVPSRRIISHLLLARERAMTALRTYIANTQNPETRILADLGGDELSNGGWFVLEPWITPSIFQNTGNNAIVDEYTFGSMQDSATALSVLQNHWETWITEDDFAAIAAAGLNHVRIPVGYWSVPLTSADTNGSTSVAPYTPGAWPYLLKALNWAKQHGVHVIIDLHGAPGSQNGFDNSGQRTSSTEFENSPANVSRTVDTISYIAEHIGGLVDIIELLNEPATFLSDSYPAILRQFWQDGYSAVRAAGATNQVMIGDGFMGVDSWTNFMTYPGSTGVMMDYHEYQIFSIPELSRSFDDHINFACSSMSDLTNFAQHNIWTVVGEWSTAVTDCTQWLNGRGVGARWDGTCDYKTFLRKYWEVQVTMGENVQGWIYWTWKAENSDDWSYQKGLEGGWIPQDPTDRLYPNICS